MSGLALSGEQILRRGQCTASLADQPLLARRGLHRRQRAVSSGRWYARRRHLQHPPPRARRVEYRTALFPSCELSFNCLEAKRWKSGPADLRSGRPTHRA